MIYLRLGRKIRDRYEWNNGDGRSELLDECRLEGAVFSYLLIILRLFISYKIWEKRFNLCILPPKIKSFLKILKFILSGKKSKRIYYIYLFSIILHSFFQIHKVKVQSLTIFLWIQFTLSYCLRLVNLVNLLFYDKICFFILILLIDILSI